MFDDFFFAMEKLGDRFVNFVEDNGRSIAKKGDSVVERLESVLQLNSERDITPPGPVRGDVIRVARTGYHHFGVFVSNDHVIHYTSADSDTSGKHASIQSTDLSRFLRGVSSCSVVKFPQSVSALSLAMQSVTSMSHVSLSDLNRWINYHLYTEEETVQRAESRLGEASYNLAMNNCEHFAIWCKTGVHESHQVQDLLSIVPCKPILL